MSATEEELLTLMRRYKFSLEVAESLPEPLRRRLLEQDEVPGEQQVEPEAQAEPVDTYAGLQAGDIVGDTRRLRIVAIDPVGGGETVVVGEAWQDEAGALHGTGVAAVMLFEPVAPVRHRNASVELDVSPLTILYSRFARSSFFRAEFVQGQDAASQ